MICKHHEQEQTQYLVGRSDLLTSLELVKMRPESRLASLAGAAPDPI